MMASSAIIDLPVERSPMISSRWPRPMGIMASMAFMPVCIGVSTPLRMDTLGAITSTGLVSLLWRGPLPSSGWPSESTTRPIRPSPTGTSTIRPVPRTSVPSITGLGSPSITAPTLSSSRLSAMPMTPPSNSRSSLYATPERPWMRAMPSPTSTTTPESTMPNSAPNCCIWRFMTEAMSCPRTVMSVSS